MKLDVRAADSTSKVGIKVTEVQTLDPFQPVTVAVKVYQVDDVEEYVGKENKMSRLLMKLQLVNLLFGRMNVGNS